jgi:hypothetical protein
MASYDNVIGEWHRYGRSGRGLIFNEISEFAQTGIELKALQYEPETFLCEPTYSAVSRNTCASALLTHYS